MFDIDEAIRLNDEAWEQTMFLLAHCPEKENWKHIDWTIKLCEVKNKLMRKKHVGKLI